MSQVTVSFATLEDLPICARIQRRAFADSAINRHIFVNVPEKAFLSHAVDRLAGAVGDDRGTKRLLLAKRAGLILGFALWDVPAAEPTVEEKDKPQRVWAEGTNIELANAFFSFDLGVTTPHYQLSLLVTDPDYQKTGAGGALLRWGNNQADRDGCDIVVESSPIAVPFYTRFGYREFHPPIVGGPNNVLQLFPMRRSPTVSLERTTSPSHAPVLASLFWDSFATGSFFTSLYSTVDPDAFRAGYETSFAEALCSPKNLFVLALRGKEIVGFAEWLLPTQSGSQDKPATRSLPPGTNMTVAEDFYARVDAQITAPVHPHYSMQFIAVDPAVQRSGIGTSLLRYGLELAAAEGLDVRLEATDGGLPLYRAHGFVESAPPIVALDGSFSVLPMMLRPPLKLAPATFADCATIANLQWTAFRPHGLFTNLFPNVEASEFIANGTKRFEKVLTTPGKKIITASRGGKVIGFAYWIIRRGTEHDALVGEGRVLAAGTNIALATEFLDRLDVHDARPLPPHYCLQILAVDPSTQRSGAGSALVKWGVEQAAADGLDVRLDATGEGLGLYERLGFEQCGEPLVAQDKSFEVIPMVREFHMTS